MVMPQGNEDAFRKAMNQGHSAAWENRWQEAVEHYSRALEEFSDNPPALNSLALAQMELGNLDQALELYRRAARQAPEDPLPVEKIALIYRQTGRMQQAVQSSLRAAELYLNLRDADKAINNWIQAIQLEPENIDARARLALVYEKLGRTRQAISEYIAVAALQQQAGELEEAETTCEYALSLNPKSKEAKQALETVRSFNTLPAPIRQTIKTGPLRLPTGKQEKPTGPQLAQLDEGPDPVEEASQTALQTLAAMLFELGIGEEVKHTTSGLRSIAKVVADGLMSRGFDEKAIVRHLNQALELHSQQKPDEAAEAFKLAIEAGLDHPAAHFYYGVRMAEQDRVESAQRSFQHAVKHRDYGLAARLKIAGYLREQGRLLEASIEYMQALSMADASVVAEDQADALRRRYEPLLQGLNEEQSDVQLNQLCDNIEQLLMRPGWRTGVKEARAQLPSGANGAGPQPLADILTQANSGRVVQAMGRINRIAREGDLRAAMEEAYTTLQFAPAYLPLHVNMGELLLMNDRSQEAITKFGVVARAYSARGESDRATQIYQRIVAIAPYDTAARLHLIDQMTAQGQISEAIEQYLEMADVFYRMAQLDQSRETYDKALRLAQSTELDSSWTAQILHQIADIDMQRLDWKKALRVYEQLRTLMPGDQAARMSLIQLNLRMAQESKASAELDNYLSYMSSRSRDSDAVEFLEKLVHEDGDFLLGRRRLAESYQQSGQRQKAIQQWNKVGEMLVEAGDREGAKVAVQHWLHEIGTLVAQKDEVLLKSLERIKELEKMFNAAPSEDRLAA